MSSVLNACAMACQSPGTAHNQLDSVVVPGDVVSMFGVTLRTTLRTKSSFLSRDISMLFVSKGLTSRLPRTHQQVATEVN